MTKTVRVESTKYNRQPGILLRFPFDRGFLETLKRMVPYTDRIFLERRHAWFITQKYADVAIHLAHQHYGGAEITDADGKKTVITAAGERCRQAELVLE
jgi:hypothetical protein